MVQEIESKTSKGIRKVCNFGFKIIPKQLMRNLINSRAYTSLYYRLGDRIDSYEKLLEKVDPYDKTILDVGVGPGKIYKTKYGKCNAIIGIDYSLRMSKNLKKLNPKARVILADAGHLPLIPDSFDISTANEVLKYSKKPEKIVEEMKRVSRETIIYTEGFISNRKTIKNYVN